MSSCAIHLQVIIYYPFQKSAIEKLQDKVVSRRVEACFKCLEDTQLNIIYSLRMSFFLDLKVLQDVVLNAKLRPSIMFNK